MLFLVGKEVESLAERRRGGYWWRPEKSGVCLFCVSGACLGRGGRVILLMLSWD